MKLDVHNEVDAVSAHVPVAIQSEANMREHHMSKAARVKKQRAMVSWMLYRAIRAAKRGKPSKVTLVRLASRKLDSDNLSGGFKAVRDEIAELCEFNDRDESVVWDYQQRKPMKGEPEGCWVKVEWPA